MKRLRWWLVCSLAVAAGGLGFGVGSYWIGTAYEQGYRQGQRVIMAPVVRDLEELAVLRAVLGAGDSVCIWTRAPSGRIVCRPYRVSDGRRNLGRIMDMIRVAPESLP